LAVIASCEKVEHAPEEYVYEKRRNTPRSLWVEQDKRIYP